MTSDQPQTFTCPQARPFCLPSEKCRHNRQGGHADRMTARHADGYLPTCLSACVCACRPDEDESRMRAYVGGVGRSWRRWWRARLPLIFY